MKGMLCPENKDYCGPATRHAPRFQSRRDRRQSITSRARIAPGSSFFIEARALFLGITGGTISVAESPRQSLDSESVACREGGNRCDRCLRSDLRRKWNYFKKSIFEQWLAKKV
jgi:hypothetical protein